MVLHHIHARGFRNIEDEGVSLDPGVNLLFGRNAEGKTNLLEAIYYFARGKSFRGAKDSELCRFGGGFFEISAEFTSGGRKQSLLYKYTGREKIRRKNGAPVDTAADMIGHLRAVLFHPEHLLLVKGSPALRREFLNVAISQVEPSYLYEYAKYSKILEERNSLLKFMKGGFPAEEAELSVWSERLAEAAARVTSARYRYMKRLSPLAAEILTEISAGRETLSLSYLSEVEEEETEKMQEKYRALFMSDLRREVAAGFTVFGPHHDDIGMEIGGHPAREFASQGQQRSVTLAMKLAEGEVSRSITGEYPLFLFDDVMSELDSGRRRFLLSSLRERQIIVTACDERDFEGAEIRLIRTEGGRYEALS